MTANVLFVDDDTDLLESICDALRKKPYKIHTSSSAGRALEMLGMYEVDVVISDERMPGLVGSEFLTQARVRFPDVVRILLTGQASMEALARAVNEGQIFRYLAKPIEPEQLSAAIEQALAHRSAQPPQRRPKLAPDASGGAPNGVAKALEASFPGITSVDFTQTGSIVLEED